MLATQLAGKTVISGAHHLKYKETDRINTTVKMISKLGGKIKATEDGAIIENGTLKGNVTIDSFNDHRIAMAASIAATICEEPVIIRNANCVNVSYPNFFEDLMKLGGIVEVVSE